MFHANKQPQDLEQHKAVIKQFTAVQNYLIQPEMNNDPCTISHPDLSLDHIFIDPETTKIVCLTGWQTTVISPPLLKRPYPRFLDVDFDTRSSGRIETDPGEFYRKLVEEKDPLRYKRVLGDLQGHGLRMGPVSAVTGAWEKDDMYSLRESLIALDRSWGDVINQEQDPNWHQSISKGHAAHANEKFARQELELLFDMVQNVQFGLIVPMDGRVRTEDFAAAKALSESYREEYLELAAGDQKSRELHQKLWPFDVVNDEKGADPPTQTPKQTVVPGPDNSSRPSFRVVKH